MTSNHHNIDKKLPTYYWVVIALCVFLLVYFFTQSQSSRNIELKHISNGITHLKNLDTQVNDRLIQNDIQLVNHYDFLVSAMDSLETETHHFYQKTPILKEPSLQNLWDEYQTALAYKAEAVEHYKSHYALLKNSLNYFFLITNQLSTDANSHFLKEHYAELLHFINETHRISVFHFYKTDQLNQKINSLSEILKNNEDNHSLPPLIRNMLTHAELIADLQLEVVQSVASVLKPDTHNILDKLFHRYLVLYEQDEQTAAHYKVAMLVIAIFLALIILFSFYRQNKILLQLSDTIDDLNFQHFALDQHAIVSESDVKGRITYVNQKFCDISGYSEDELLGQNHRLIKSDEHSKEFYKDLWKTIATGHVWHGEIKNKAKDGSFYWINATIVPFVDKDGKPFKYTSIRTDITQQKKNEVLLAEKNQFLDHLTNTIGEGVYALDTNGHCLFVNKQAEKLLGYSAEEMLGQAIHPLIHYQDKDGNPISAQQCESLISVNNGFSYIDDNQYFTRKDGSMFPVRLHSEPFFKDGKVSGSVSIFQDITVQKETEEALHLARQEAEAHSKQKSEFLANMSHELRTPMNAIIGLTFLTLETRLDDLQRQYLEKIQSSSQILLDLINDVLDLSKIEAGKVIVEQTEFKLGDIIRRLEDLTQEKARIKNLQLEYHVANNIPDTFIGDPLRITQVLCNLIYNAIKFTEHGSVTVRITSESANRTSTGANIKLLFEVIDTGIGLTLEQQDNIFSAFTQADTSTTREHGGTGLGLSITRQLVELMHGELKLDSSKGQGSRFYFSLPLKALITSEHKKPVTNTKQDSPSVTDFKQARILLVEDNKVNQMVAKALLKRFNLDVSIAENGQEAVDKIANADAEKPYQLILMDIQMPVMDGIEATEQIRQDKAHGGDTIPVIALTAHAFEEEKQRCFKVGMNGHISKPIKPDILEETLLNWLTIDSD